MHASARIVLDEAIVARAGDHFVLRSASPMATIGGGVITDPVAPPRARPFEDGDRSAAGLLATLLGEAGAKGVDVRELPVRLGITPSDVAALVDSVAPWRVGQRLLAAGVHSRLNEAALDVVNGFHKERPLEPGAPIQWVRSKLDASDDVATAVLEALTSESRLVAAHGVLASATFAPSLDAAQKAQSAAMLDALASAGKEPPSVDELSATLRVAAPTLVTLAKWLVREGSLVPVEADRFYAKSAVDELRARLAAGMSEPRDYAPAELRDMLGLTRKFLIPFLEYCDREGYTIRSGLGRRLAARSG